MTGPVSPGEWRPPPDWGRITTIDVHAAGEPLRIVTGGVAPIPGDTMLAKRRYARERLETIRRRLMWEPRGHADMYGCLPTEPVTADGDIGVLFLHNEGFSTMCGHGIIGLVTAGFECGFLETRDSTVVNIDTPAGRVVARANREGARVASVTFRNVPAFVLVESHILEVTGLGKVSCTVAFGGAFYAYVDADTLGLSLEPGNAETLIAVGKAIKKTVAAALPIRHPNGGDDLSFLYGTVFVRSGTEGAACRNVCVFADGEVDRSPTGTGVSGLAAIRHSRGELTTGETLTVESIVGTTFSVQAVEEATVGDLAAIIPEVTGSAHVTGRHEFLFDSDDQLADGFLLR